MLLKFKNKNRIHLHCICADLCCKNEHMCWFGFRDIAHYSWWNLSHFAPRYQISKTIRKFVLRFCWFVPQKQTNCMFVRFLRFWTFNVRLCNLKPRPFCTMLLHYKNKYTMLMLNWQETQAYWYSVFFFHIALSFCIRKNFSRTHLCF